MRTCRPLIKHHYSESSFPLISLPLSRYFSWLSKPRPLLHSFQKPYIQSRRTNNAKLKGVPHLESHSCLLDISTLTFRSWFVKSSSFLMSLQEATIVKLINSPAKKHLCSAYVYFLFFYFYFLWFESLVTIFYSYKPIWDLKRKKNLKKKEEKQMKRDTEVPHSMFLSPWCLSFCRAIL